MQLFVERAHATDPTFTLDETNAEEVAELCRRLDGLPLALELAAAQARVLPPRAMLERLEARLPLLSSGSQDSDSRQQTLEATIAWSYGLLSQPERDLFARLAVFSGGFRLEAAESLAAPEGAVTSGALEGVASLLGHSLLRRRVDPDGEPRYWMLETIREFARAQLERAGTLKGYQRLHANHFISLAEQAEPELWSVDQAVWSTRLDCDHDNFRAALAWALSAGEADSALRLVGALEPYWETRGHIVEGRRWLTAALAAESSSAAGGAREGPVRRLTPRRIEGDYLQERSAARRSGQALPARLGAARPDFALAHLGIGLGRLGEPPPPPRPRAEPLHWRAHFTTDGSSRWRSTARRQRCSTKTDARRRDRRSRRASNSDVRSARSVESP